MEPQAKRSRTSLRRTINNLLAHIPLALPEQEATLSLIEQETSMDLSSDEEHGAYLDGSNVVQVNSDERITEIDMFLEEHANFPFTQDDLDDCEEISSSDGNIISGNIYTRYSK
jgi:hypothetical protein